MDNDYLNDIPDLCAVTLRWIADEMSKDLNSKNKITIIGLRGIADKMDERLHNKMLVAERKLK